MMAGQSMRTLVSLSCVAVLMATTMLVRPLAADSPSPVFVRMEQYFDSLRRHVGIPGLSAAILLNGRVAWERGFGHADISRALAAAPDTPYHVGELTQTFTSVLLMECVERGTLSLDELVQAYRSSAPALATIRHAVTQTAGATPPGSRFTYDTGQWPRLSAIVNACAGVDHRLALGTLLARTAMRDSVPGPEWASPSASLALAAGEPTVERYQGVLARLATPYRVDRPGSATPSSIAVTGLDGSTGLISTARDLGEFLVSLEREVPLRAGTLQAMWSPFVTSAGQPTPTGLGWFVQQHNGMRVVWQFGTLPHGGGALLVSVPERRLALVLLANSDRLNAPYALTEGDLTRSPFARTFLSFFL
jgi:CubicO group peptidase (beta-lactamase class C family)